MVKTTERAKYEYKVEGKESSTQRTIAKFYVCYRTQQAKKLASYDGIDQITATENLGLTEKSLDSRLMFEKSNLR